MTTPTDPRAQLGAHSHRRYWTMYRDPNAIVDPPPTPQAGRPGGPVAWLLLAWAAGICFVIIVTLKLVLP